MRPVLYAGAGATRYNLATSPPGRTPDIEGLGVAVTVPVGLGFQWVLGGSKALEILGGYTYTMKDDINGAIHEQGNDVFYGVTIGLTFGNFGPRAPARPVVAEPEPTPEPVAAPALEAQPAVEASPAPEAVAAEPAVAAVPVAAAEPAPQAVEATPATGTDLSFAPTYFATGSATLSPNGRSLISEIAKTVERLDEIVLLEVRGYADARGARNWNRSLARKRAEAVKAALVEEGIAVWRIRAVAVGETEPVQGQVWRGRRVEIVELE